MKQSRCWKAGTAAVLIVAGLSILPREGAAWSPYIDPIEPILFGEPDEPNHMASSGVTIGRLSTSPGTYLPVTMFFGGARIFYIYLPAWYEPRITRGNGPAASQSRTSSQASTR